VGIGAEIPSGPVADERVVVHARHVHKPAHTPDVDAFALKLQPEGVQDVLARWRPYAGIIYMHLLLDSLSEAGLVNA